MHKKRWKEAVIFVYINKLMLHMFSTKQKSKITSLVESDVGYVLYIHRHVYTTDKHGDAKAGGYKEHIRKCYEIG